MKTLEMREKKCTAKIFGGGKCGGRRRGKGKILCRNNEWGVGEERFTVILFFWSIFTLLTLTFSFFFYIFNKLFICPKKLTIIQ